ncbi:SurA N-terminal domain-containing protein, partial [Chloroflexota bacterium]
MGNPASCEGFAIVLQSKYRIVLSVFVFVLMLFSGACGGNATPAAVENPPVGTDLPTIAPTVAPEPTEELVAVVNSEAVTRAQFEGELRREAARLAEIGVVPADQTAFEATVLTNLIDQKLIEQAAEVQGLQVTADEVNTEIALNIEMAGSEAAFQEWLAENLFTSDEYHVSIYSALLTAKIR